VFDRPLDFPRHVVVRCQRVGPAGIEHAQCACLYDTMAEMRAFYAHTGYTWLDRQPEDDPMIVGVWI
jgi:hypothetical protein